MLKEIQPSPVINTSTLSSSIYVTTILNYYHMSIHVRAPPLLKEEALLLGGSTPSFSFVMDR